MEQAERDHNKRASKIEKDRAVVEWRSQPETARWAAPASRFSSSACARQPFSNRISIEFVNFLCAQSRMAVVVADS
jgi:hypothetical protein